jgi:hypothetical protein
MPPPPPLNVYYTPRPHPRPQVPSADMPKLRKLNPNQHPPETQITMLPEYSAQEFAQDNDVPAPIISSRGLFTEPEKRLEQLRSHPPRSPTPSPPPREDAAGASKRSEKADGRSEDRPHMQFPRDFNPDMFAGVCWCCGSTLVRDGLGEKCVECWADQIVY